MVCAPAGYAETASTVGIAVVPTGSDTRYMVCVGVNPGKELPFTLMSFRVLSDSNATENCMV